MPKCWVVSSCAVFQRVSEPWGAFSNMHNGFPLEIAGWQFRSSEALYQACRFPDRPEWQEEIRAAPHAMRAKMMAKKEGRRKLHSRPDWADIQLEVMRWCLRLKLQCHLAQFGSELLRSGVRPIVEKSRGDQFWGAVESESGILCGENWLGRLLMELRDDYRQWLNADDVDDEAEFPCPLPQVPGLRLLGQLLEDPVLVG